MSHLSRISKEAWAGGLGRPGVPEQLDFPWSAGKQVLRKKERGKGGVCSMSWSPQWPRRNEAL